MPSIRRDPHFDSTFAFLSDGYEFISRRCRRWDTDAFSTRLLLNDLVCVSGPEAAREFYDPSLFARAGVMPASVRRSLVGENGVQTLDGDAHAHRKAAFMSLMSRDSIDALVMKTAKRWDAAIERWQHQPSVVLFDEAQLVLCRAACVWAGVPLADFEASARARDLASMIDAFGAVGLRNWRGRWARTRSERWLGSIIERIRTRTFTSPRNTALHTWAWYRSADGTLLPSRVAAVELLNVIRPIVGISYYVAFAGAALLKHPRYRDRLRAGELGLDELFAQEVRRFYPFAPFLGARTLKAFDSVTGGSLGEGQLVLLDVYGTSRDPRVWQHPERFLPERFKDRRLGTFDFIPQGGGDPAMGHRCAGEAITVALLTQAVNMLARSISFDMPQQDLSYSLARIPTYPRSRVMLSNVRREHVVAEEPLNTNIIRLRRSR